MKDARICRTWQPYLRRWEICYGHKDFSKLQLPGSKLQGNIKLQIPSTTALIRWRNHAPRAPFGMRLLFDVWRFSGSWCLGLGSCFQSSLVFGASLDLGVWVLEL